MKAYNKPEIFVTRFVANAAISACQQSTDPTAYTFDTNQTVNCFITTSEENLFSYECDNNAGLLTNSYIVSGDEVAHTDSSLVWSTAIGGDGNKYWTSNTADDSMYYYLWENDTDDTDKGPGQGGINENFVSLLQKVYAAATKSQNAAEEAQGWHVGFIARSLVQQVGQPS